MNKNLRYTRFKEDVYSNIEVLKDTLTEVFDNHSYEFLQDKELNRGLTTFDEDNIQRKDGKISIEIPLIPIEFEKLPKNRDTRKLILEATNDFYNAVKDGIWIAFENPSENYGYFSLEDLKDYGVTKKNDITKDIIDDIVRRISNYKKSRDTYWILNELAWESSKIDNIYNYNLVVEASFRTFKGTDSVDVILKMYIVEESPMGNSKKVIVDSYEPQVFGFTTDIIEGRDKDGNAYIYLDSMLEDLTSQF